MKIRKKPPSKLLRLEQNASFKLMKVEWAAYIDTG